MKILALPIKRHVRALPFVLAIALFLFAIESKATGVAPELTLDELIAIGLRDNPNIKAGRLALKSAEMRYPQARAFDDPVFTYTEAIDEVETRLGPNRRSVMLSQKLPYPGKRKARGLVAEKDAEIARVALRKLERDLVLDIKKAYYDIYYLDKASVLARERIKVFSHFSKAEMNDYSVGATRFSDVVSAETRFADAEYDLILFEELRGAAESTLNALLDRSSDDEIASVADPAVVEDSRELKELYRLAELSDEATAARLSVQKNSLKEDLAGFKSRPNFMLGVKYSDIGDPVMPVADGGKDAVAITLGVTLPIWGGKNRAARDEARYAREASERKKSAVSNGINARIKRVYADMRSSYQLVRLYSDTLKPKARKLIDTVNIMYKNGNGSIADLFEARVMLINFSLAHHRAVSNYLKSRAELERLTNEIDFKEVASNE
jgi:outer membrane protein TolC